MLNSIDPQGVSTRRRKRLQRRQYFNKGPNYLRHVDGYHKLKPYGICISGCTDGSARKILWLKAASTNNNPRDISGYYIQTIKDVNGCPRTVRSDMDTENVHLESMQIYFHEVADNVPLESVLPPFLYGTSHSNQRIESWWAILRKHNTQFWINDVFRQMTDDIIFDCTLIDKSVSYAEAVTAFHHLDVPIYFASFQNLRAVKITLQL